MPRKHPPTAHALTHARALPEAHLSASSKLAQQLAELPQFQHIPDAAAYKRLRPLLLRSAAKTCCFAASAGRGYDKLQAAITALDWAALIVGGDAYAAAPSAYHLPLEHGMRRKTRTYVLFVTLVPEAVLELASAGIDFYGIAQVPGGYLLVAAARCPN